MIDISALNKGGKVLICDANFCTVPLLKAIKKNRLSVAVVGVKKEDPCHHLSDKSYLVDYSNKDLLFDLVKEGGFDYIVPGCNDQSYISSAFVAEKLNKPGYDSYETTLTIHHKDKFREYSQIKKYPMPKVANTIEDAHYLKFPLLIKPVNSFSGKGIVKVENKKELKKHAHLIKNGAIVEEFVKGELYSHSAFIKDGNIVVDFFVNEYCTIYPYQVNSSNLASTLKASVKKKARDWLHQFARDLKLCNGLVHTQFISQGDDFWLVEVARRCPGDLYSELIRNSTGINYSSLYSLPFLGIELPKMVEKDDLKFFSRHTASVKKDCVFVSSQLKISSRNISNVQLKLSGEPMKAAPYGRSGIYFIESETADEMEKLTKNLYKYVVIEKY